ncbi:hypothetical protein SAMN04487928_108101 [Butyrivibrio proteoclasticus]|uniref:Cell surface protein n=1 Tax=Butyrivibrio proteoclasticus TaxID=43305 RepID=A0A1I5TAJ4_9FIRM|nr:hypothetical protein [Butyrivibrio proteoclasticus]SFP80050.1 hypothetical protein SAMN04487928_108101 [Butyrivibrio proteoclasticus]
MNMKLVKKVLAVTMAASMIVMPLTAGATDSAQPSSSDTTVTPAQAEAVATTSEVTVTQEEEVATTSQVTQAETTSTTTNNVIAGGTVIKNELPGAFQISSQSAISGVAIRQSANTIKTSAGLSSNQTPFARVYTLDPNKSKAVYASFNAAAEVYGGSVVAAINSDLGALTGGKFTSLPEGVSVPVTIGIKNFDPNAEYYIIKVSKKGLIEKIPVTIENGKATFDITGGLSAYALMKK